MNSNDLIAKAVLPDVETAELLVYNLPIEAETSYALIESVLATLTATRLDQKERIQEAVRKVPCAYLDAVLTAIDEVKPR